MGFQWRSWRLEPTQRAEEPKFWNHFPISPLQTASLQQHNNELKLSSWTALIYLQDSKLWFVEIGSTVRSAASRCHLDSEFSDLEMISTNLLIMSNFPHGLQELSWQKSKQNESPTEAQGNCVRESTLIHAVVPVLMKGCLELQSNCHSVILHVTPSNEAVWSGSAPFKPPSRWSPLEALQDVYEGSFKVHFGKELMLEETLLFKSHERRIKKHSQYNITRWWQSEYLKSSTRSVGFRDPIWLA